MRLFNFLYNSFNIKQFIWFDFKVRRYRRFHVLKNINTLNFPLYFKCMNPKVLIADKSVVAISLLYITPIQRLSFTTLKEILQFRACKITVIVFVSKRILKYPWIQMFADWSCTVLVCTQFNLLIIDSSIFKTGSTLKCLNVLVFYFTALTHSCFSVALYMYILALYSTRC